MEPSLQSFSDLESKNVYIHYSIEHYSDGSNLNFSIEFKDYARAQTYWYNDNHEFGNVEEAMVASIKLAYWHLENPERIEMINASACHENFWDHQEKLSTFVNTLLKMSENET